MLSAAEVYCTVLLGLFMEVVRAVTRSYLKPAREFQVETFIDLLSIYFQKYRLSVGPSRRTKQANDAQVSLYRRLPCNSNGMFFRFH